VFLGVSSVRPTGMAIEPGFTFAHYAEVYGNTGFWRLLRDSAIFAGGSATVAITLGTLLAWAVERTDMPGRGAVRPLVILPMATLLLLAIGWAMLLSPRACAVNLALMEWLAQFAGGIAREGGKVRGLGARQEGQDARGREQRAPATWRHGRFPPIAAVMQRPRASLGRAARPPRVRTG
jgi:ABC-type sugar transport system permease subunit